MPQPPAPEVPVVYNNLWRRIAAGLELHTQHDHSDIDDYLDWYIDNPRYLERITQRAAPFLYLIVEEVEARALPMEIALLPIIESAFDPNASSPQNAVGLWQFMAPTARSVGLQSDWWYDGRRDPLASTRAALDYLEFLHEEFDQDWLLALAAYNAGEGNVRRALARARRSGNEEADFWGLRLPEETRNHVPRLIALGELLAHADTYALAYPELANRPHLALVETDFQLDLAVAANMAGVEEDLIRSLNPGYLQWATHPVEPQSLLLPIDRVTRFRRELVALPADQRVTWARYEIRSGDTLSSIANRFDSSVGVLRTINNLRSSRIIAGHSLLIPRRGSTEATIPPRSSVRTSNSRATMPTSYRVRRGDSLWAIARRFDLLSEEIAAWNDIELESLLQPGQVLMLQANILTGNIVSLGNQPLEYEIEKGDSLDRIARRFGVSVDDLVLWNAMDPAELIFPGQIIKILLPGTDLN